MVRGWNEGKSLTRLSHTGSAEEEENLYYKKQSSRHRKMCIRDSSTALERRVSRNFKLHTVQCTTVV